MRKTLSMLSLSLVLAAPLTLGQIAMAQEAAVPPAQVQNEGREIAQDNAWRAYANSGYTYWDAMVLSRFWGTDVSSAKSAIGHKVLSGYEGKVRLDILMSNARTKALANVDDLKLYSNSGFKYQDAKDMAKFWGSNSAWEGKLMIEKNMILGHEQAIRDALNIVRKRR